MIPHRKPPFGLRTITRAIINWSGSASAEQVENAYAQAYDMPYAILLPSCRAGICWALKTAANHKTRVLCTAYVCRVVWEAIRRSEGKLHLIDLGKNSFLMNEDRLRNEQVGNYALVLCEVYGYSYDLLKIARQSTTAPAVRIIDMAMTVPTKEHFERLGKSDFAVTSFGAGKCMYAGWGGMAFTHDADLAEKVRQIRNGSLTSANGASSLQRPLKMLGVNLMYKRLMYGFLKRARDIRETAKKFRNSRTHNAASYPNAQKPPSKEWFSPPTYVERNVMLYNLQHAPEYAQQRTSLVQRYHKNFEGVTEITRPDISPFPMSHYTIRVGPEIRHRLRKYLWGRGIDTGTLFDFSGTLSPDEFPNAGKTASSILNLPLTNKLNPYEIDRISEFVIRGCLKYS